MKPHETEALAVAVETVAEQMPRFRGAASAVFARVREMIDPDYLNSPWLTDTQSFINQLRSHEMESALLQHRAACWIGTDGRCRLIYLDRPRSAEEAKAVVKEQPPLGLVCRYCGIEDSRDELNPLQGTPFFIHDRCAGTWQAWRIAAK